VYAAVHVHAMLFVLPLSLFPPAVARSVAEFATKVHQLKSRHAAGQACVCPIQMLSVTLRTALPLLQTPPSLLSAYTDVTELRREIGPAPSSTVPSPALKLPVSSYEFVTLGKPPSLPQTVEPVVVVPAAETIASPTSNVPELAALSLADAAPTTPSQSSPLETVSNQIEPTTANAPPDPTEPENTPEKPDVGSTGIEPHQIEATVAPNTPQTPNDANLDSVILQDASQSSSSPAAEVLENQDAPAVASEAQQEVITPHQDTSNDGGLCEFDFPPVDPALLLPLDDEFFKDTQMFQPRQTPPPSPQPNHAPESDASSMPRQPSDTVVFYDLPPLAAFVDGAAGRYHFLAFDVTILSYPIGTYSCGSRGYCIERSPGKLAS
jgi:hypothetical protein